MKIPIKKILLSFCVILIPVFLGLYLFNTKIFAFKDPAVPMLILGGATMFIGGVLGVEIYARGHVTTPSQSKKAGIFLIIFGVLIQWLG